MFGVKLYKPDEHVVHIDWDTINKSICKRERVARIKYVANLTGLGTIYLLAISLIQAYEI